MINSRNIICFLWLVSLSFWPALGDDDIRLIHVVSVNKFYAPVYSYETDSYEIPRNLSYFDFNMKSNNIPNSVKNSLFNLGVYLRDTYNATIGDDYTTNVMDMTTTEFPVSIMASELISAGLWQPVGKQIWNDEIMWQPTTFHYELKEKDDLLLGTLNPSYQAELMDLIGKDAKENPQDIHDRLYEFLRNKTNIDELRTSIQVALLYNAVEEINEYNTTALPQWAIDSSRESEILKVAIEGYNFLSKTASQRRLNGGLLLEKILTDSRNHIAGNLTSDRKIIIYNGDDRLLGGISAIFNMTHPLNHSPNPGAALIFELHNGNNNSTNSTSEPFLKVHYYLGDSSENPAEILDLTGQLRNCTDKCSLQSFEQIIQLSTTVEQVTDVPEDTPKKGKNSSSMQTGSIFYVLIISFLTFGLTKM